MTNSLEKQKIVVIGGSSGIGLAVAKAVAAEGAKLIVASRSESKLEQAKAEIGGETETYQLNISSEESVKNFFWGGRGFLRFLFFKEPMKKVHE